MLVLGPRIAVDKSALSLELGLGGAANRFHIRNTGDAPLCIQKLERSESCKAWTTLHVGGAHSGDGLCGPWSLSLPPSLPLSSRYLFPLPPFSLSMSVTVYLCAGHSQPRQIRWRS